MTKMCDCSQGRLPCHCEASGAFLSLTSEEVRAFLEQLRILKKAKQTLAERSPEENAAMTRDWKNKLAFGLKLFPKITVWDEQMRLHMELERRRVNAEFYRYCHPSPPPEFGPVLHKALPDILRPNMIFKIMCQELGGWK